MYEITDSSLLDLRETWDISDVQLELLNSIKNKPLSNSDFKKKIISIVWEDIYRKHRNLFKRQSLIYTKNIKDISKNYKSNLASYLYFSCFAFLEAFILDLLKEITQSLSITNADEYIFNESNVKRIMQDIMKLDKEFDPRKNDRYAKYSDLIRSKGYKTPEELLSSSLLDAFNKNIDNLKAGDIPNFLEKNLFYKMTEEEIKAYSSIRDNRNSIWHGASNFKPDLDDVLKVNEFFKEISRKIDSHVIFYFIKPRNYKESKCTLMRK